MGIRSSVGRGGANFAADVTYIQQLLNLVAPNRGGPAVPFTVFGMPGNGLNQAILRFQQANCPGIADCRIDPGGKTLSKLVEMARAPGQPVRSSVAVPPLPPPGVMDDEPLILITLEKIVAKLWNGFSHTTPWTFTSSAGASLGARIFSAGVGKLYLKNSATGETPTLSYGAVGMGVSVSPGSLSYSTKDMWSMGVGQIRARHPGPLSARDMTGPMSILSGAAAHFFSTEPNNVGFSIYVLGRPGVGTLLKTLKSPDALYQFIAGLSLEAKAVGMMIGAARSEIDIGMSAIAGVARLD